jgi:hypothetical protein
MLVSLPALVPRVFVVVAVLISVPIAFPGLGDDASGGHGNQCKQETTAGNSF